MPLSSKFSVEISPPVDPDQIDAHIAKFEKLLKMTSRICLVSRSDNQITGFDRAYNLARALTRRPDIRQLDITFHVTCYDLNRVNIETRLTLMRAIGVKRILVITGEKYDIPGRHTDMHFANSTELAEHILRNFPGWLDSIAIAGYPESAANIPDIFVEKCRRLNGIDTVYTQCVFEATSVEIFVKSLTGVGLLENRFINCVPSIAVFKDSKSLIRCARLSRVKVDEALSSGIQQVEPSCMADYSKNHLIQLCSSLFGLGLRVNICTFGLFEMTEEIMSSFS